MKYFQAEDLEAFASWWLTGGKKTRSASTLQQYRYQYRRFLAWAEANGVTTFTVRSVQGYVGHCRSV